MKKENKNLDELFREKLNSDKRTFLFNQEDWDVLERKLNLDEKFRKRNVFLFRTLIGVAAALLTFFSIWLLKPSELRKETPQTTVSLENKNQDHEFSTKQSGEQTGKDVKRDSVYDGLNASLSRIAKPSSVAVDKNNLIRNGVDNKLTAYTMSMEEPFNEVDNQLPINERTISEEYSLIVPNVKVDKNEQTESSRSGISVQPDRKKKKDVVLSVLVAPALNGVSGFKNGEFGSDFGFLVSVGLTKRLNISTGAVYAKKLYDADFNRNTYPNIGGYGNKGGGYGAGSYNASDGYNQAFPAEVYADCRVLDIPLNINYSLIDKGKNALSVGTGMSSYLMLREKYQFEYSEQTGKAAETLSLKNENKHIMSVVNFQTTYTRQLNSKVGISLQPYLKIPLTDIGYAKVRLQSVGMAVNINFRLGSKEK